VKVRYRKPTTAQRNPDKDTRSISFEVRAFIVSSLKPGTKTETRGNEKKIKKNRNYENESVIMLNATDSSLFAFSSFKELSSR